jgi:hypothetical protein
MLEKINNYLSNTSIPSSSNNLNAGRSSSNINAKN